MLSRQAYVDAMKSAFVAIGVDFTLSWLGSNLPWTRLPVIRNIVKAVAEKYWSEAARATEFAAFIYFIDTRVNKQGNDFVAAAYANHAAQKNGTPEEKARAESDLKKAHTAFVHLKS